MPLKPNIYSVLSVAIYFHNDVRCQTKSMLAPNETSPLAIKAEISKSCSIPDHQQGIRCKAPRSDRRQRSRTCPCESRDDALMVIRASSFLLTLECHFSYTALRA
jgi:hypothetical protein